MRRIRRALAVATALYLLGSAAGGAVLVEGALRPPRRSPGAAADLGARVSAVEIAAADGVRLRGWLATPASPSPDVFIVLHGVGDSRGGMVGFARALCARGRVVLLPDARAHGQSGGELATYGVLEADDVRRWAQWLLARGAGRVFGLGESMGAAILLQSLGRGAPLSAVVAESSFASFREIAFERVGQAVGAGPWLGRTVLRPLVEAGIAWARLVHGIDLASASPEDAVARSQVPVLLVHGIDDTNIPPRHSRRIRARGDRARLWLVPGAGHCGAMGKDPDAFVRRVLEFVG